MYILTACLSVEEQNVEKDCEKQDRDYDLDLLESECKMLLAGQSAAISIHSDNRHCGRHVWFGAINTSSFGI